MTDANVLQRTRKLTAGLAFVLLLLLLTFMAAFSWNSWAHQKAQRISTMETVLDIGSGTIDSYFVQMEKAILQLSRGLASNDESIDLDHARILLQEFQDLHPELANAILTTAEGQILAAANAQPGAQLPSLANQDSFKRFLEERRSPSKMHIGQPTVGAVQGLVIIPLRYAAEDSLGHIRFIVSASLRADHLRNFWKEAPITENAAIGLLRDNGFLISRYPVPGKMDVEEIYGTPRTGTLIQHIRDNNYPASGHVEGASLDGPDSLNVFKRLRNYPITMFITMPMSNIRSDWWNQVAVSYALTILLIVGGGLAFTYHLSKVNEGIRDLQIARNNLSYYSEELRKLNVELEQFAYIASHDLRQPLRMVTSYLGLIEKRLDSEVLTDELRSFLGFAVGGARRMDRLINDLLKYSRTGRTTETMRPVPLCDVVADSLSDLALSINEAGAEVTVAETLPTVVGDHTELTRLFQNLIGNAVKYRHPDRKPRIDIGSEERDGHIVVWVGDNGIGIAADQRDRAFAIFQRLVPKDDYEGTGIGLAVCKKIVEHCGGKIWIESELGEGSRFLMTFPMPSDPAA